MDARDEIIEEEVPLGLKDAETDAKVRKLLVTLRDDELAATVYAKKSGLSERESLAIIQRNRRSITERGSAFDVKREIGQHLEALDALYGAAVQAQDHKTALAVEKEVGKTLSLYHKVESDINNRLQKDARERVALEYLESTGVIESGLDITEAARLVAQYVIDEIRARQ